MSNENEKFAETEPVSGLQEESHTEELFVSQVSNESTLEAFVIAPGLSNEAVLESLENSADFVESVDPLKNNQKNTDDSEPSSELEFIDSRFNVSIFYQL